MNENEIYHLTVNVLSIKGCSASVCGEMCAGGGGGGELKIRFFCWQKHAGRGCIFCMILQS
jgi:hypothetical protein